MLAADSPDVEFSAGVVTGDPAAPVTADLVCLAACQIRRSCSRSSACVAAGDVAFDVVTCYRRWEIVFLLSFWWAASACTSPLLVPYGIGDTGVRSYGTILS